MHVSVSTSNPLFHKTRLCSEERVQDVEAPFYSAINVEKKKHASLEDYSERNSFFPQLSLAIGRFISLGYISQLNHYELVNAISMVVPTMVSFALCYGNPSRNNKFSAAVSLATLIHLPFSFAYHWYMAVPHFEENWALLYHRLDSAFIHAVSSLYAYGISQNIYYALLTVPFNLFPIILLWRSESRDPNTKLMTVSVALYLLPYVLWERALLSFLLVSFSFWITLRIWEKRIFGLYYHSMMHVMMGIPQALIVLSTLDLIPRPFFRWGHSFFGVHAD